MYHFLMHPKRILVTSLITVIIIFNVSCMDDEVSLFYGADPINLLTPEKGADVYGDIHFTHTDFYSRYVNIAIFSDQLNITSKNSIENWEDCIGGIRSNMPGFVRGEAYLSEMRPFSMDDMDFTGDGHVELEIGKTYYWAVWGLNERLTRVSESSPSYTFVYVEKPLASINLTAPEHWDEVGGNINFKYSGYQSLYLTVALFDGEPSYTTKEGEVSIDMNNCLGGHDYTMKYYTRGSVHLNDMKPYSSTLHAFDGSDKLELTPGETYYWMVWGLDSTKSKIAEISYDAKFVVE